MNNRESQPHYSLEEKRMQLIETIADKRGQLIELDPTTPEAKSLKLSIGHLEHSLQEIETNLGYGKKAA